VKDGRIVDSTHPSPHPHINIHTHHTHHTHTFIASSSNRFGKDSPKKTISVNRKKNHELTEVRQSPEED